MSAEALKMVVHFGEGSRIDGRLASDVLMDMAAEAGVGAAVLLRGIEGFGIHHRLRTDRLLSTSEDLPLVLVALDSPTRIVALADRTARMLPSGLLILERATVAGAQLDDDTFGEAGTGQSKLAVYCARPLAAEVAAALRPAGIAGATVLAGVDGLLLGARGRGRVLSRNRDVPALVLAVGSARRVAAVLPRVRAIAGRHVIAIERVSIVRRDGAPVGPLPVVPHEDDAGLALWQRLTVICGETTGAGGPMHVALIRDLRAAGGPGATAIRGAWAYTGDANRHADRLLAIRRRSPVLVTLIARPAEMLRLWPIVERATATAGLVTCELLPAVRISPPVGPVQGGLTLARPEGAR